MIHKTLIVALRRAGAAETTPHLEFNCSLVSALSAYHHLSPISQSELEFFLTDQSSSLELFCGMYVWLDVCITSCLLMAEWSTTPSRTNKILWLYFCIIVVLSIKFIFMQIFGHININSQWSVHLCLLTIEFIIKMSFCSMPTHSIIANWSIRTVWTLLGMC